MSDCFMIEVCFVENVPNVVVIFRQGIFFPV